MLPWRLSCDHARDASRRQYTIQGLMLATACAALVLGVGRWILGLGVSPNLQDADIVLVTIVGGVIALSCIPIPFIAAVVLTRTRRPSWSLTLVATIVFAASGVLGLLIYVQVDGSGLVYFAIMLSGAYLSAAVHALVLRGCGYTLVREPRDAVANASASPFGPIPELAPDARPA